VKKDRRRQSRKRSGTGAPHTLAIDIGGTHIKASVLDRAGNETTKRVQVDTPHPAPPAAVLKLLEEMLRLLPAFDRISVGFPGVVKRGRVITAPNLGTTYWHEFPLATRLARRWRKPARILNDAEVQGFGVIRGKGLECVLTLGTGFGSAMYRDGELMPHLELGQHPIWKSKTYDQYLGAAALKRKGLGRWNRRVERMLAILRTLLNYDHLYLGGGNAAKIDFKLPPDVTIVSNEAGITGGIRLWDRRCDRLFE
jgi:polyphosphate glucokinase